MIFDSSRRKMLKYSVGRTDIATYSPTSKVVWNRENPRAQEAARLLPLMHGVPFAKGNGTYLLMTTVEHPKAEALLNYRRSESCWALTS